MPLRVRMAPSVPANLPDLVRSAFRRAVASRDVLFFPTHVTLIAVNSIPFQLRFSPSLANKPRAPLPAAPTTEPSAATGQPKKPAFDPFDNPAEAMLVASLGTSHNLILNKFAIVPEHFILATKAFEEQTDLLSRADLEAAYACIQAYHAYAEPGLDGPTHDDPSKSELYVFYNSGPASGSSQPHRHLQLLPVARMREGLNPDEAGAWDVLANRLLDPDVARRVPFQTFAERIGPGADLETVYLRLYQRACEAVLGSQEAAAAPASAAGEPRPAKIDYNLAMTRDVLVVAPRVAEGSAVTRAAEEAGETVRKTVGTLALNGTVLAGTALVKSEAEWDALRAEPEQLLELLGRVGVPNVYHRRPRRSSSMSSV
ncbi:hypothetical protein VTJ83DRAFT_2732 [Remersonia thermophila]|uniref:ATP adenylyltransferase n=1 Tax=Remersonia thermophila TaxID=72144 RepID=A0ABR4DJK4_9PEZI